MDRRAKIIIGIFVTVLLGIIVTEIVRPKPLNWRPSYTLVDKIPFGCYVLYHELPQLFPNSDVTDVTESVYDFLVGRDTTEISNYLLINDYISLDQQEGNQLLDYVKQGNDVFMAANSFGTYLSDTLNLVQDSRYQLREDTLTASFTNRRFTQEEFHYARGIHNSYFTSVDTLGTTVLGNLKFPSKSALVESENESNPINGINFIQVKFGKGNFYLNSLPEAFTNYYLLQGNQDYVAHSFSYLKDRPVYWDNYKKSGRIVITSPLRFVLNQPALKWAYYLTIIGIVIFMTFRAKREQRIIPVIEPLGNSSVEFARTVGSLYFQKKDYGNLISKKLKYFMGHVRSHYYVDLGSLNEQTILDFATRSGKSISETRELVDFIVYVKNKKEHNEQDLIQLNKKIMRFRQ